MKTRRRARELALKLLYENDASGESPEETLSKIKCWCSPRDSESVLDYCQKVVRTVLGFRGEIDERVAAVAENWRLDRMSIVDRNIIRLAVAEMLYCPDIPPKVSINEAIDIARKYGDEDSGRFVNGILDRLIPRDTPESTG
jgi:N utilization substance protein B